MDVEKAIEFILQSRARHEADVIELRQLHIAAEKRVDRYVRLGAKLMDRIREDTDRKVNALTESHLRLEEKFNRWLDSQPGHNGSDRPQ